MLVLEAIHEPPRYSLIHECGLLGVNFTRILFVSLAGRICQLLPLLTLAYRTLFLYHRLPSDLLGIAGVLFGLHLHILGFRLLNLKSFCFFSRGRPASPILRFRLFCQLLILHVGLCPNLLILLLVLLQVILIVIIAGLMCHLLFFLSLHPLLFLHVPCPMSFARFPALLNCLLILPARIQDVALAHTSPFSSCFSPRNSASLRRLRILAILCAMSCARSAALPLSLLLLLAHFRSLRVLAFTFLPTPPLCLPLILLSLSNLCHLSSARSPSPFPSVARHPFPRSPRSFPFPPLPPSQGLSLIALRQLASLFVQLHLQSDRGYALLPGQRPLPWPLRPLRCKGAAMGRHEPMA
mmetsp:Transcript_82167/g.175900  ORF Transcript_82167/g.175900 Transcript_82167/m.175900 type:complete len:353 (-) Transcript_82167:3-1061(-)